MISPRVLTAFQRRTLQALVEVWPKGMLHEKLYPIMFPKGRFNADVDHGSTKGGPSRIQYAVNVHMGKLGRFVYRQTPREGFGWAITSEGRKAIK